MNTYKSNNLSIYFFQQLYVLSIACATPIIILQRLLMQPYYIKLYVVVFLGLGALVAVISCLFECRVPKHAIFFWLVLSWLICIMAGLFFNDFNYFWIKHIISGMLPILGLLMAYQSIQNSMQKDLVKKIVNVGYCVSFFTVVFYILRINGILFITGASTNLGVCIIAALCVQRYRLAMVFLFIILLSFKRSECVASLICVGYYFYFTKDNKSWLLMFLSMVAVMLFFDPDLLSRFDVTNFSNVNDISSGRIDEIKRYFDKFKSFGNYLFGLGAGWALYNDGIYRHYTHITLFSFYAYSGLVGLWIYLYIFFNAVKSNIITKQLNFFDLVSLYYMILSIFGGASLMSNVYIWFCLGVSYFNHRINKKEIIFLGDDLLCSCKKV